MDTSSNNNPQRALSVREREVGQKQHGSVGSSAGSSKVCAAHKTRVDGSERGGLRPIWHKQLDEGDSSLHHMIHFLQKHLALT